VAEKKRVRLASLFTDSCIPLEYEAATIERLSSLQDGAKAAAIAAATELIDTGEVGGKTGLCVIGDYGVGKTYLLSAVLRTYLDGGESGLWLALAELFREVQRGYSQGNDVADQRIDAACNAGVLMLDDFGRVDISGMETTDKVRIIDTIINYRHNMRKPTLITSNLTPERWVEQFGRRTADRVIKMCSIVGMGGQNLRLI
jgi:DNA replication protein DnaC